MCYIELVYLSMEEHERNMVPMHAWMSTDVHEHDMTGPSMHGRLALYACT
jgi:hypothetical protein